MTRWAGPMGPPPIESFSDGGDIDDDLPIVRIDPVFGAPGCAVERVPRPEVRLRDRPPAEPFRFVPEPPPTSIKIGDGEVKPGTTVFEYQTQGARVIPTIILHFEPWRSATLYSTPEAACAAYIARRREEMLKVIATALGRTSTALRRYYDEKPEPRKPYQ